MTTCTCLAIRGDKTFGHFTNCPLYIQPQQALSEANRILDEAQKLLDEVRAGIWISTAMMLVTIAGAVTIALVLP